MKNIDLALRIKELRINSGYSQAELANIAKLSLRTVQRIESGEAGPRGDTLRRLAVVLNMSPEDLIDHETRPDKMYLLLLNLSALSFIIFPLLGVIVPMIFWTLKKDKMQYLSDQCKRVLNFEITWFLFATIVYILSIGSKVGHVNLIAHVPIIHMNSFELFMIIYFSLYLVNIVFILINVIRVQYDRKVIYFLSIRFLR